MATVAIGVSRALLSGRIGRVMATVALGLQPHRSTLGSPPWSRGATRCRLVSFGVDGRVRSPDHCGRWIGRWCAKHGAWWAVHEARRCESIVVAAGW